MTSQQCQNFIEVINSVIYKMCLACMPPPNISYTSCLFLIPQQMSTFIGVGAYSLVRYTMYEIKNYII